MTVLLDSVRWTPVPGAAFAESAWSGQPAAHPADWSEARRVLPDACDARLAEFTAGRDVARAAGRALGLGHLPLPRSASGSPRWPTGCTGSITHCRGYAAAMVAPTAVHAGVGVDAEPWAELRPSSLAYVAGPDGLARVEEVRRRHPGVPWGRVQFTVMEAVYKALCPLGTTPTFGQVSVAFADPRPGTSSGDVTVTCRTSAPALELPGRWAHRPAHDVVVAAVWVPHEAVPPGPGSAS